MTETFNPADDINEELLNEILTIVDARKDKATCGEIYATVAAALGQCVGITILNAGESPSIVNETWKIYAQLSLDYAHVTYNVAKSGRN